MLDPFERIDREGCRHEQIQFGSGDYYIFCHNCGASWAMIRNNSTGTIAQELAPEDANKGVGSQLSGKWRKATDGESKL